MLETASSSSAKNKRANSDCVKSVLLSYTCICAAVLLRLVLHFRTRDKNHINHLCDQFIDSQAPIDNNNTLQLNCHKPSLELMVAVLLPEVGAVMAPGIERMLWQKPHGVTGLMNIVDVFKPSRNYLRRLWATGPIQDVSNTKRSLSTYTPSNTTEYPRDAVRQSRRRLQSQD